MANKGRDRDMPAQQGEDRERDEGFDERGIGDDTIRGVAEEEDDEAFEETEDEDEDEEETTDEGSF